MMRLQDSTEAGMLIWSMSAARLPCLSGGCLSEEMFACVSEDSRSGPAVRKPFICFSRIACCVREIDVFANV